jgi:hypothetical protein
MRATQLDRGQDLVVLARGGIVVADQGVAVAGQNPEAVERGVATVVGTPDQTSLPARAV